MKNRTEQSMDETLELLRIRVIFSVAGSLNIYQIGAETPQLRYTPEASVLVRRRASSALDQFVTRFGGKVRQDPFGRSAFVQWWLRSSKGIRALCQVLDWAESDFDPRLRSEIKIMEAFVAEDGRGLRGRAKDATRNRQVKLYKELRRLQAGRWASA